MTYFDFFAAVEASGEIIGVCINGVNILSNASSYESWYWCLAVASR